MLMFKFNVEGSGKNQIGGLENIDVGEFGSFLFGCILLMKESCLQYFMFGE